MQFRTKLRKFKYRNCKTEDAMYIERKNCRKLIQKEQNRRCYKERKEMQKINTERAKQKML